MIEARKRREAGMTRRTFGRIIGRVAVGVATVAAVIAGGAGPALAAKGGGPRGGSSTPTGNDISYPQCGTALPTSPAFAIVGVNDGLANNLNPCFGPSASYPSYSQSELYWALAASVGDTTQPRASLYVNTGDPGDAYNGAAIADWPSTGTTPYGTCSTATVILDSGAVVLGANSDACAWQYGYNMAVQDVGRLQAAATAIDSQAPPLTVAATAASYPWWLDVETGNSWQADTTMNVADLQGMIAALQAAGATTIGAYSTSSQWNTVTGGTGSASGALYQLPTWLPGARTLSGARSNCEQTSFTAGRVVLTQWFAHPDGDYAC
jgi:hypothetical protein